ASGDDRIDVFCRGVDDQLWSRTWTSESSWSPWSPLGGAVTSDPDAASTDDPTSLRIVARGLDGAVRQYAFVGGQWTYAHLGGLCTSGPTATYVGDDRF